MTYENVLLQLDIIPLINADKEVTLQIRQTNNSLGGNVTISGNQVPNIDTQEINTEVTVKNNSTVVIGGLIRDTTEHSGAGLPWLSDIPVLGYLFGATDKAKKREELIIMIQPTVVADDVDQVTVDNREEAHTLLGPDVINAAAGVVPSMKDTMPWSPNARTPPRKSRKPRPARRSRPVEPSRPRRPATARNPARQRRRLTAPRSSPPRRTSPRRSWSRLGRGRKRQADLLATRIDRTYGTYGTYRTHRSKIGHAIAVL